MGIFMRAIVSVCALATMTAAFAMAPQPAAAKGCIKGAIVGGLAGYAAGGHKWKGALAGCLVGRYAANRPPRAAVTPQQQFHDSRHYYDNRDVYLPAGKRRSY
jgi:uncharacterized protein YcfJ